MTVFQGLPFIHLSCVSVSRLLQAHHPYCDRRRSPREQREPKFAKLPTVTTASMLQAW